jgi:hypothetical protein
MSTRLTRRVTAGATVLALAGLGLIGIGATAASAADTITPGPHFGGTFYLYNGAVSTDVAPGTGVAPWGPSGSDIALVAPGDFTNTLLSESAAAALGAQSIDVFLSPRGSEENMAAWNAMTTQANLTAFLEDVTPQGLLNSVPTGSPSGQAAVQAAGGNYSLGFAYLDSANKIVKEYYVHITVTAGSGNFTYQPVQAAVVKTATTTTITTAPPASLQTGQSFTVAATVAPAAATGTVQFYVGSTALGAPQTVTGGVATLNGATISTAGNAQQITAVYSGDASYATSTSAAVSVDVTLAPVTTSTSVAATSADNVALHPATLTATVTPASAVGSVVFTGSLNGDAAQNLSGAIPVSGGLASITISGLTQGTWTINAAFTGTSPFVNSASTTAATLTLTAPAYPSATPDAQNVTATIDQGALIITTPWTAANPLALGSGVLNSSNSTWTFPVAHFASASDQSKAIQVVDTRAGVPGFTAQVSSTDFKNGTQSFPVSYMGLVNVAAHQVTGNAIQATDVVTSNVASLSASAQTFATYHPAASTLGTAWISGDLDLHGVPTSVQPGTYTATLTFTAF